MLYKGVY